MSRSITSKFLLVLALLLPSVSWGAITRTGSISDFVNTANSGTQGVTVPADAEIMVVGLTGSQSATASFFSGGTLTVNGAALTCLAFDADNTKFQGALCYKVLPSTGAQTLAWDWAGASAAEYGAIFVYAFYKGIDTASAIR